MSDNELESIQTVAFYGFIIGFLLWLLCIFYWLIVLLIYWIKTLRS